MGYDKYMSLLYSAPAGAVLCVSMIFLMWLGDKTRARLACGIAGACIGMMGVLLLWQLPSSNTIGRLMGYYL